MTSTRQVTSAAVVRPIDHMHSFAPIRFAAVASFAISASLCAQSPQAIPRTPTQAPSTLPANQPTTPATYQPPLTPAQRAPSRAQVTYVDGTLSVSADNSSLNQILREISSDTGLKITGGVADERVFGRYGPATPEQVLSALLDGTGSNMLFVQRDGPTPAELVLTPRHGGPTPPNPNAAVFDNRPEPQEPPPPQAEQSQPAPAPNGPAIPPSSIPATPGGASPDGSQPDSPNGVKTPQQIYEQLQRMRQQQQQQQPTQPQ